MKSPKVMIVSLLFGFIIFAILIYSLKSVVNVSTIKPSEDNINYNNAKNIKPDKVFVYYFKRKGNCYSCVLIQAYTTELLQRKFKDQLREGELEYRIINVEERGNRHYIKEFRLFSNALVLAKYSKGQKLEWKKLNKVWDLYRDKSRTQKYIYDELTEYLDN